MESAASPSSPPPSSPPSPSSSSSSSSGGAANNPTHILYVREIPRYLDTRELERLFGREEGFVALRRLPFFAFVEFTEPETATNAMRRLNNYRFSPHDRGLLIDYDKDAKKRDSTDSKKRKADYLYSRDKHPSQEMKRDHEEGEEDREKSSDTTREGEDDKDKDWDRRERSRERARDSRSRDRSRDYYSSRGMGRGPFDMGYDPFQSRMGPYPPMPGFFPDHMGMDHFAPEQRGTLYVTNMPKDVTERELSILFRFMPGFSKVRLVLRDGKAPICFVDFVDPSSAYVAMQTLQGFRMDLRDPTQSGLVVEFDKGSVKERPRRVSSGHEGSSSSYYRGN